MTFDSSIHTRTMSTTLEAYRAATTGAVFLDRSDRVRLELTGPDRAKRALATQPDRRVERDPNFQNFVVEPLDPIN